jgi:hypothetical protein
LGYKFLRAAAGGDPLPEVNVVTQATDAQGIAAGMGDALDQRVNQADGAFF